MQDFYIIDFARVLWVAEGVNVVAAVDDFNYRHKHRADVCMPAERCGCCKKWLWPRLEWYMQVSADKGVKFCGCKRVGR